MKKKKPVPAFFGLGVRHGVTVPCPPAQKRALGLGGSKSARATRAMRHARAGPCSSVRRSSGPTRDRTEDGFFQFSGPRTGPNRTGPVRAGPRSGPVSDRKLHIPTLVCTGKNFSGCLPKMKNVKY